MKKKYNKEYELYYQISSLFKDKEITFFEVPYNRKRIDIIFTNTSLDNFYSVEAKLYDWKKALKQALINQIFSQYSYIALPDYKVLSDELRIRRLCKDNDIGLISVSSSPRILIKAKLSKYFDLTQNNKVKKYFRNNLSCNQKVLGEKFNEFGCRREDLEFLSVGTHLGEGIISA